jgi:hypothetical protein
MIERPENGKLLMSDDIGIGVVSFLGPLTVSNSGQIDEVVNRVRFGLPRRCYGASRTCRLGRPSCRALVPARVWRILHLARRWDLRVTSDPGFLWFDPGSHSTGPTPAKPNANNFILVTQRVDACKDGAADCLLLLSQMVAEKLMPSDVAGVHPRDGVVHEELGVDF